MNSNNNRASYPTLKMQPNSKMSGSAVMSVFEHQRLVSKDFAEIADFAWLLAQEFSVFTIKRQRGQWQLKVGHYVGIILLPSGMMLEILPKAIAGTQASSLSKNDEVLRARQWTQLMLSDLITSKTHHNKLPHTKNLGQLSQHLAPFTTKTPPLSQWLVEQFLQLLSGYQPTKHYQTQIHHQSTLQGKLLIKEQLKHNSHQPHKLACEVTHLTTDMLANRLIKSAFVLLKQLAGRHRSNDSQALSVSTVLMSKPGLWQHITELSGHERQRLDSLYLQAKRQLQIQPLTRLQLQSAHQLLDLAHWLLQVHHTNMPTGNALNCPYDHQNTYQNSQLRLCLLINMNQAFEQWASGRVAKLFDASAGLNQPVYQTFHQQRDIWLSDTVGQTCLSMQPDLLVYDMSAFQDKDKDKDDSHLEKKGISSVDTGIHHCSHVIDVKWKHLSHAHDISASDAYQLTSYAQAYQAEQVWLVYPVTDNERQPVALRQPARAEHPILWLMPFNVTTGMLNTG